MKTSAILSALLSFSPAFSPMAHAGYADPATPGEDPRGIAPWDLELERKRRASAAAGEARPSIESVYVNGVLAWKAGDAAPARVRPGSRVRIFGRDLGQGVDIDYSKVMIGNVRVLERDLNMYEGKFDYLKMEFYEKPKVFDAWLKQLLSWSPESIEFTVPEHARSGWLSVQVQKRVGANASLVRPATAHTVWDPLTERIRREPAFKHASDLISTLSHPLRSNLVPLSVENPGWDALAARGEAIFWSYDFNLGMAHYFVGLDWTKIMKGEAIDPTTGQKADPRATFGAIPLAAGEVPAVAALPYEFDVYPMKSPLRPPLGYPDTLKGGKTTPTGYAGYVYAEAINPVTGAKEKHIGFNCAACHAQLVEYEAEPGRRVAKIVPGLPNVDWTMRWNTLGKMEGVKVKESTRAGKKEQVDKTFLIAAVPPGTAEASIVRPSDEEGMRIRNDQLFTPVTIPIITRHLPVRRALSRNEMFAGFEGSYVHSQEPDGTLGAMNSASLKALTAYMSTLDRNDQALQRVGLYRTLAAKGQLGLVDGVSEGAFVRDGADKHPKLASALVRGKDSFGKSCLSCHATNYGTWTDENMMPISEVGTYFSPTIFQRETESIRTSILQNLFWVQKRGLLHDGHVKTMEDLVHPDRVRTDSELYRRLYTLNPNGFKVFKGNAEQERATRNHLYFVDVPWTKDWLYWDYQKMLREFGPRELGSKGAIKLPAAPHPWPAASAAEVDDLVLFLMTL